MSALQWARDPQIGQDWRNEGPVKADNIQTQLDNWILRRRTKSLDLNDQQVGVNQKIVLYSRIVYFGNKTYCRINPTS